LLLKLTFFAALGVLLLVESALLFTTFRYRARPSDPNVPLQIHGDPRLEIVWTIVPIVLLAVVAAFTAPIIFATQAPH